MESTNWTLYQDTSTKILDESGNVVGRYEYEICTEKTGVIGVRIGGPTGEQYYLEQIPGFKWPVAFLEHIEAWPRRKGHGSRGLDMFIASAKEAGAVFAMLRVGWNAPEDERGNEEWYRTRGWVRLLDDPDWKGAVPIMFRPL